MTLSSKDFTSILANIKRINTDILWEQSVTHPDALNFVVQVEAEAKLGLTLHGYYNPKLQKLSYVLVLDGIGRIYGLDIGQGHKNPDGILIGAKHKHRWSAVYRNAKDAYVPADITASPSDPIAVWKQFCEEARIIHSGIMFTPQLPAKE